MTNIATVSEFRETLMNYEKSIMRLLQSKYNITVEDFIETCMLAVKGTPKLLQCDPKSLFGAILISAECGLKPNTSEQLAFILPYKGQAKFQVGYKGLIEMMYRNPRVQTIRGEAVFKNDEFDYAYGLDPYLIHKPLRNGDRGELDCVYAVCKLKDAEPIFTVVEKDELNAIKGISSSGGIDFSAYNNGTDVHHFMEIKASIKKISKLIPKSSAIEIAKAIDYDSKFEGGAKAITEILTDPSQIAEPSLIEGTETTFSNKNNNSFDTAFDEFIDETGKEEPVSTIPLIFPKDEILKMQKESNASNTPETKTQTQPIQKETNSFQDDEVKDFEENDAIPNVDFSQFSINLDDEILKDVDSEREEQNIIQINIEEPQDIDGGLLDFDDDSKDD